MIEDYREVPCVNGPVTKLTQDMEGSYNGTCLHTASQTYTTECFLKTLTLTLMRRTYFANP